ncbi:hypothetical protein ACQ4PT_036709 [Festuca glaucescens]
MSEPATQCRGNVGGGEGGGGGMRTVECLRGRLQAERVASKAAKEEADQLATRLDELEKQLAEEVKVRNKAERRLRRAIKRLESLKILDVQLSPSETSIGSLSSNSTGCSGQEPPDHTAGSLTSTIDSVRSGPREGGGEDKGWDGDSDKGSSAGSCTTQANSSQEGSWFSVVSEQSGSGLCCKEEGRVDPDGAKSCGGGSGDGAAADAGHDSQRESEQPAASSGSSKSEASLRDEEDDRLALVLVDNPHYETAESGRPRTEDDADTSDNREPEAESNRLAMVLADPQPPRDEPLAMSISGGGSGNDVQSVLLALRQVKEQLRYTIERRSEGLVAHRELYGH